MKKWTAFASALALTALSNTPAHAGGFTPWGGATGDKTVALSPYFFVAGDGTTTLAPYVFVGATDHFDIMFGYSFSVDPNPEDDVGAFSSGAIEIMPRAIINDSAVFALHALYTPGDNSAVLGLEFHGVTGSDYFGFTYNAGWWPTIGGDEGFNSGDVFGVLVPEFFINERFSMFAEFNPGVTIDGAEFFASVVPGVTFYVDKDMKHSLTAAAILSVAPTFDGATFGLLYFTDFDTGNKKTASRNKREHRGPATQGIVSSRVSGF